MFDFFIEAQGRVDGEEGERERGICLKNNFSKNNSNKEKAQPCRYLENLKSQN